MNVEKQMVLLHFTWWSMVAKNDLVTRILLDIFLCIHRKKEMYTDREQLEGENHSIFIVG